LPMPTRFLRGSADRPWSSVAAMLLDPVHLLISTPRQCPDAACRFWKIMTRDGVSTRIAAREVVEAEVPSSVSPITNRSAPDRLKCAQDGVHARVHGVRKRFAPNHHPRGIQDEQSPLASAWRRRVHAEGTRDVARRRIVGQQWKCDGLLCGEGRMGPGAIDGDPDDRRSQALERRLQLRQLAELVAGYRVPIGHVEDKNGGTSKKVREADGRVRPVMQSEMRRAWPGCQRHLPVNHPRGGVMRLALSAHGASTFWVDRAFAISAMAWVPSLPGRPPSMVDPTPNAVDGASRRAAVSLPEWLVCCDGRG
jgi:hypothetical protein